MNRTEKLIEAIMAHIMTIALFLMAIGIFLVINFATSINEIYVNIGAALIISSFLYIMFDLSKRYIKLLSEKSTIELGLRKIYRDRSDLEFYHNKYADLINHAKNSFIAVGLTLDSFLDSMSTRKELKAFLARGGRAKLLFISLDSAFLLQRGIEQGDKDRVIGKLRGVQSSLKYFCKRRSKSAACGGRKVQHLNHSTFFS